MSINIMSGSISRAQFPCAYHFQVLLSDHHPQKRYFRPMSWAVSVSAAALAKNLARSAG